MSFSCFNVLQNAPFDDFLGYGVSPVTLQGFQEGSCSSQMVSLIAFDPTTERTIVLVSSNSLFLVIRVETNSYFYFSELCFKTHE